MNKYYYQLDLDDESTRGSVEAETRDEAIYSIKQEHGDQVSIINWFDDDSYTPPEPSYKPEEGEGDE